MEQSMTTEQIITLIICGTLVIWNITVFLTYYSDKRRSIRRQWRIPEATLIIMAFAGGGVGAICGMYLIRHKTKHFKFRLLVPLALISQIAAAGYVLILLY
ncbi:MAG: DUF1294 domain-containing protein [Eubacteriales bacterium]|nr:DUF1294 domain-containing protein [Eubacteriales bacterium]